MKFLTAGLAAGLLVAAACGDSGEEATLTDTKPPAPTDTTEVAADTMEAEEPAPAAPAPPPALEGVVAPESLAGLVQALAAQSGVTSSLEQVYVSVQVDFDGMAAGSVGNVPYVLFTTVGERTHARIDQGALAALSALGGMPDATPADLPPIEIIVDGGAQQTYVKLRPLAGSDPAAAPLWLRDLAAARAGDITDLWGRVGPDGAGGEVLDGLDLAAMPASSDFLAVLAAASDGGHILEARADGGGEVAGVATQIYGFVVDLAGLAGDWPPFLDSFLGGPGGGGSTPEGFLGELPPLPADLTVAVDGGGFVREVQLDLDMGAIMMAAFAGFDDTGEMPDDADMALPEIQYLLSVRFETLAVNDPSLAVALPDPALVVDLP